MRFSGKEKSNVIKRFLSITLALLLLFGSLPGFAVKTSAADPRTLVEILLALWNLTGVIQDEVLDSPQVIHVSGNQLKNDIKDAVRLSRPDSIVKIEGDRVIYELHDFNTIQIGEYLFNRYNFGTKITREEIMATGPGVDTLYIPFFIYKGDLYFERGFRISSGFSRFGYNVRHGIPFANQPQNEWITAEAARSAGIVDTVSGRAHLQTDLHQHFIIGLSSNYSTYIECTSRNVNTNVDRVTRINPADNWNNISRFVRQKNGSNIYDGVSLTTAQVFGNDSLEEINNGLHNFAPNQGGIGVFVVPHNFAVTAGMSFMTYLTTLEPQQVFTQQQPEIETQELELPEELRNLGDNDTVEITIDGNGNITFNVILHEPGGGGGNCHCDDCKPDYSGFWGWFQQILGVLKSISAAIVALPGKIVNSLEVEFVGNLAEGIGQGVAGVFGGTEVGFFDSLTEGISNSISNIINNYVGGSCHCEDCKPDSTASGSSRCRSCNGTGQIDIPCDVCEGFGDVACNHCDGIGCVNCDDTGVRDCGNCSGSGEIKVDCNRCDGKGNTTIWDLLIALINLPSDLLNALGLGDLIGGIPGLLGNIIEFLDIPKIISSVLEFLDNNIERVFGFLEKLIIPSAGFFENKFNDFDERFNAKIPIVGQGQDMLDNFIDIVETSGNEPPEFRIQGELFGTEINQNIIDFEPFEPYRKTLHNIIITFSYIMFFRSVLKRIPKLLGGI
jgi:hypothetical protein